MEPMIITIPISDCPISGLERQAKYKQLLHSPDSSEVKIKVEVSFLVEAKGLSPWQVDLTADNSTQVNPENGDFLDEGEIGIGQYDFIIGAMEAGVSPFFLIRKHMINADLLGRYN